MKRLLIHLVLFSIITLGCSSASRERAVVSPESVGLSSDKLMKVDMAIQQLVTDKKIAGGIVAIARHGQIAYLKSFGKRDLEADVPMTDDTIFRIYSMTKAITSVATLMLVEEGKINLDDPVGKHVKEMADLKLLLETGSVTATKQPTIRDLLRHTAGMLYGGGSSAIDKLYQSTKPMQANNLNDFAKIMGQLPLAYEPGTDWIYSVSIDVAGLVVERVSGQPLDEFFRERIFKPLDMPDTGFDVPSDKLHRFAAFYQQTKDGLKRGDHPTKFAGPVTFYSGGGGLVSTARDYMRFLMMIRNGGVLDGHRLLQPQSIALMTTNQLPEKAFPIYFGKQIRHGTGFGLGFSVSTADTEWDPAGHIGEYGWGGMASTHYWTSPKDDLTVITLEQRVPYTFETEFLVKGLIYDAIIK